MIFIYISSNSIQHEFFIYLICRTVIKTSEVLIFLYISKMSFRLNGTCLAFSGFPVRSGYWHGIFLSVPPIVHWSSWLCSFSASFSASYLYRQRALCFTSAAVCTTIYLKGLCISILLFALCPEMPQFTFRHGRYRTVHLQRSLSSCCNIYWYLLN